ncbi:hypothetical protein KI387_043266 [Taxus chinensis]|uniref:Uncharacterized protein n=1 Tax=Taxus chinensis TaxID=29808 RepID=A0AA38C8J0_TAXCH|nr:hypothetical protein KI387_043266 [Taxus chinensis]
MTVMCNDAEDFHTHGVNPHINHLMIWREDNDNEADGSHALVGLLNDPYCSHFCTFQKNYTMGGQLKRLEPTACDSVKNDVEVWNIFLENGITTFLERMAGYSALVSYVVMASWSKGQVQIGNTRFTISTNAIADATGLPAAGDIYFKHSLHVEIPPLVVSEPPASPVFPPHLSCLFLEGTDTSFKAVSPVSSPDSSLAADILGLAKLYPDSPDSEQLEKNQPVDDPTTQTAGTILSSTTEILLLTLCNPL